MKKILFAIVLSLTALKVSAYDFLRAVKDSIPEGYNFWVYTPVDYFILKSRPLSSSSCMEQAFAEETSRVFAVMVLSMPS